jgi:hypothetical protein
MTTDLETPPKPILLKSGEEVVGLYRKMRSDACNTNLVLERADASLVKISFRRGSNEERIIHDALLCVKHNVKIRIQKLNDPKVPIQVQKFRNLRTKYSPTRTISLRTGEEIVGFYRELQKDAESINLVLELTEGSLVQICFPKGSFEADIVRTALFRVKHNVKLRILKLDDEKTPIRFTKMLNLSTKDHSIYADKHTVERLEAYCEPGILNPRKRISNAISRTLDMIENKQIIVVVLINNRFQCNKMQNIGKTDESYCSHLGGTVSRKFCLEKCVVANVFRKTLGGGINR